MRMKLGNVEREVTGATAIHRYKKKGYKEVTSEKSEVENTESATSLDNMTVDELRVLAKEKGISGVSALKKDELLAVLKDVSADE